MPVFAPYFLILQYNYGSVALLHELFHHLGLQHPWGPAEDSAASCNDDDYVLDTPMSLRKRCRLVALLIVTGK